MAPRNFFTPHRLPPKAFFNASEDANDPPSNSRNPPPKFNHQRNSRPSLSSFGNSSTNHATTQNEDEDATEDEATGDPDDTDEGGYGDSTPTNITRNLSRPLSRSKLGSFLANKPQRNSPPKRPHRSTTLESPALNRARHPSPCKRKLSSAAASPTPTPRKKKMDQQRRSSLNPNSQVSAIALQLQSSESDLSPPDDTSEASDISDLRLDSDEDDVEAQEEEWIRRRRNRRGNKANVSLDSDEENMSSASSSSITSYDGLTWIPSEHASSAPFRPHSYESASYAPPVTLSDDDEDMETYELDEFLALAQDEFYSSSDEHDKNEPWFQEIASDQMDEEEDEGDDENDDENDDDEEEDDDDIIDSRGVAAISLVDSPQIPNFPQLNHHLHHQYVTEDDGDEVTQYDDDETIDEASDDGDTTDSLDDSDHVALFKFGIEVDPDFDDDVFSNNNNNYNNRPHDFPMSPATPTMATISMDTLAHDPEKAVRDAALRLGVDTTTAANILAEVGISAMHDSSSSTMITPVKREEDHDLNNFLLPQMGNFTVESSYRTRANVVINGKEPHVPSPFSSTKKAVRRRRRCLSSDRDVRGQSVSSKSTSSSVAPGVGSSFAGDGAREFSLDLSCLDGVDQIPAFVLDDIDDASALLQTGTSPEGNNIFAKFLIEGEENEDESCTDIDNNNSRVETPSTLRARPNQQQGMSPARKGASSGDSKDLLRWSRIPIGAYRRSRLAVSQSPSGGNQVSQYSPGVSSSGHFRSENNNGVLLSLNASDSYGSPLRHRRLHPSSSPSKHHQWRSISSSISSPSLNPVRAATSSSANLDTSGLEPLYTNRQRKVQSRKNNHSKKFGGKKMKKPKNHQDGASSTTGLKKSMQSPLKHRNKKPSPSSSTSSLVPPDTPLHLNPQIPHKSDSQLQQQQQEQMQIPPDSNNNHNYQQHQYNISTINNNHHHTIAGSLDDDTISTPTATKAATTPVSATPSSIATRRGRRGPVRSLSPPPPQELFHVQNLPSAGCLSFKSPLFSSVEQKDETSIPEISLLE